MGLSAHSEEQRHSRFSTADMCRPEYEKISDIEIPWVLSSFALVIFLWIFLWSVDGNILEIEVFLQLTFIITQTSANPIDTSGDEFDVYRRLAESTHGDLFVIDKNDIPAVSAQILRFY